MVVAITEISQSKTRAATQENYETQLLMLATRFMRIEAHAKEAMSRPGISTSDVVRAYVSLMKQGRQPSLLNLRLELRTGSYSTIAAHLEKLSFVQRSSRFERTKNRGRPRRPR
jgi:hypothetical protein